MAIDTCNFHAVSGKGKTLFFFGGGGGGGGRGQGKIFKGSAKIETFSKWKRFCCCRSYFGGSTDDTVIRALASYIIMLTNVASEFKPGVDAIIWAEFVVGSLSVAPRVSSPGSPVSNSNSTRTTLLECALEIPICLFLLFRKGRRGGGAKGPKGHSSR